MGKPPAAAWETIQNSRDFLENQSRKEGALTWARAGLPVFPCKPADKSPFVMGAFKAASTDLRQIEAWWVRWPDAMIGLPTGPVSGVWVLDIDAPETHGVDGRASLAELEAKHGPLPATRTHATAGGGLHMFFKFPTAREIARTVKQIAPGIDVKADGGYVIVPPSTNSTGQNYTVEKAAPLADAPAWLLDLAFPPFTAPVPLDRVPASPRRAQGGDLHPYVQAAVAGDLAELSAASEGTRNDTLNAVSFNLGQWVGGGELPEAEARGSLEQAAAACGLHGREVEKTIASGLAAGMKEPRTVPESKTLHKKKTGQPMKEQRGESAQPGGVFTNTPWGDKARRLGVPPPYDYLLKDSLCMKSVGLIFGPPGAGKGTLALQLLVAVASGEKLFDYFEIGRPRSRACYLSAEDDSLTIHKRLFNALAALPEHLRAEVNARIEEKSVLAGAALATKGNECLTATEDFHDLLTDLEGLSRQGGSPALIVLDTLIRFAGIDENDNPAMSYLCGLLETLAERTGAAVLVTHHSNKTAGDCVNSESELYSALSQTALRGASALAGSPRWLLAVAPLGDMLATQLLGKQADGYPPGHFLAIRVCMNNSGPPGERIYLERGEAGILRRILPDLGENDQLKADARALADEVARRQQAGEAPLSQTRGGVNAFGWNKRRATEAARYALKSGWLSTDRVSGRKGLFLCPPLHLFEQQKEVRQLSLPGIQKNGTPTDGGTIEHNGTDNMYHCLSQ